MKALSLLQPWAWLFAHGLKKIETRGWSTTFRGTLLVHAGLRQDKKLIELCHEEPFRAALRSSGIDRWQQLPRGGVIGRVEIVDCLPIATAENARLGALGLPPEPERSFGDYRDGRWAWLGENHHAFSKMIPYPGRQRIFEIPAEDLGFN